MITQAQTKEAIQALYELGLLENYTLEKIVETILAAAERAACGKANREWGELRQRVIALEIERDAIKNALEQLISLSTHYAKLLNMYDGGKRIGFKNADEWMERVIADNFPF